MLEQSRAIGYKNKFVIKQKNELEMIFLLITRAEEGTKNIQFFHVCKFDYVLFLTYNDFCL